jgi:prefoldin subunit 5
MKLNISKLLNFLLSIKSIIFINLLIIFKKKFNQNLKIVFFYFPVKSYQNNILELIDEIRKENNLDVILAYNKGSSNEVKNYDKAFFLNLGYLKYIHNVDIFLSSYIVYEFPNSLNKIYINHDIYDAPWVNPEVEKKLITTLARYDYIFLSSDIAISDLKKKINQYKNVKSNENKISLINTGYLKLDHVYKNLKENNSPEESILLAPTLSSMLTDYNLDKFVDSIIEEILKNHKFKLIYRPHPGDLINKEKKIIIKNIYEKYKRQSNFSLDDNTSYLESYRKSKILVTDFSGTAYTYAFSKLRPVIFFSKNEEKLKKSELNELFYFKDRATVGKIIQDIDRLNEEINSIDNLINYYSTEIDVLRSKRIKFFKVSIKQNLISLKNILNVKKK